MRASPMSTLGVAVVMMTQVLNPLLGDRHWACVVCLNDLSWAVGQNRNGHALVEWEMEENRAGYMGA